MDRNTKVQVKLEDVSAEKALRTVLEDAGGVDGLRMRLDEGVVTISTKDDLSRQTVTRVYDVRDLIVLVPRFVCPRLGLARRVQGSSGAGLFGEAGDDDEEESLGRQDKWGPRGAAPAGVGSSSGRAARPLEIRDLLIRVPNFAGPRIRLSRSLSGDVGNNAAGTGGLFADDDDDDDDEDEEYFLIRRELVDDILNLIRATIAPDTWRGGDAAGTIASIRELNGMLVVTQTPENHQALAELLRQLRGRPGSHIRIAAALGWPESLFTPDARPAKWVAEVLTRVRGGKLSRFSSVRVREVSGRTFARIGGVWFDADLTAADEVRAIRPGTAAFEAIIKARPRLKACFELGPVVIVRAAAGLAFCADPRGIAKAGHPDAARILKALGR